MYCLLCICQDIEEEAVSLIDHSFMTLRSSTAAFNMLLKFKHIRSREAINSRLRRKFDDVLFQFCKEVLSDKRHRAVQIPVYTLWCGDCPFNKMRHFPTTMTIYRGV